MCSCMQLARNLHSTWKYFLKVKQGRYPILILLQKLIHAIKHDLRIVRRKNTDKDTKKSKDEDTEHIQF